MLDSLDLSDSLLRQVLWDALDRYSNAELLTFCRDHDTVLRTSAAKKLHLRGEREVFDAAMNFGNDADFETREVGAFILGQLGTPEKPFASEAIPILQKLADDPMPDVRAAAIAALGHLSISETIAAVLAATSDPAVDVRQSAAFALGGFDGEGVLNALKELLQDEDAEVREWAEVSLDCVRGRANDLRG